MKIKANGKWGENIQAKNKKKGDDGLKTYYV